MTARVRRQQLGVAAAGLTHHGTSTRKTHPYQRGGSLSKKVLDCALTETYPPRSKSFIKRLTISREHPNRFAIS